MTSKVVDILARTIYGEARGEKLEGMEAIASVVLNRVAFSKNKKSYWWGNDIISVCKKPWQFSCWNENDINFKIISDVSSEDAVFSICKRIAMRAAACLLFDRTLGATHYHTKNIRPKWAYGKIPCCEIGDHLFYNDIER